MSRLPSALLLILCSLPLFIHPATLTAEDAASAKVLALVDADQSTHTGDQGRDGVQRSRVQAEEFVTGGEKQFLINLTECTNPVEI
jgi:hypothetical protein